MVIAIKNAHLEQHTGDGMIAIVYLNVSIHQ
jgi:hypothetical protein